MSQKQMSKIKLSTLRTDITLCTPIYDAESEPPLLLLSAGTKLTETLLQLLAKRGINEVRLAEEELDGVTEADSIATKKEQEISKPGRENSTRIAAPSDFVKPQQVSPPNITAKRAPKKNTPGIFQNPYRFLLTSDCLQAGSTTAERRDQSSSREPSKMCESS